jgi:hypothetical protein
MTHHDTEISVGSKVSEDISMDSEATPQEDNNISSIENQQEKLCYVYRHIRLDTNVVFYIGKGTMDKGKYKRANSRYDRNKYWHNIVKKHNYIVEIIIEGLTEKDAFDSEVELILHYGRIDLGTGTLVNMTAGGDGACGTVVSEETRKKRSNFGKGNTYALGYRHTEEAKKRMSIARMGNTYNLGKKCTEETLRKKSDAQKGRKHTEETKEKMRNTSRCKRVWQYKDGIFIKEYKSANSTKIDGYCPCKVTMCCRGKRNHHRGFQWKYV